MFNFNIIASGSSGNSYLIETLESYIFIDIGISCKKLKNIIQKPLNDKEIYLFITHEHNDHISGYKTFLNQYKPQVFCTEGTAIAMYNNSYEIDNANIIETDKIYEVNDFDFIAFNIHHDASEPVGYKFDLNGRTLSFATDLGMVDDYVLNYLKSTDLLILESNYEEEILKNGKYPLFLKKRIASHKGHLSNKEALNTISKIASSGIGEIYLSHISDENNNYETIKKYAEFIEKHYNIKTNFIQKGQNLTNIKLNHELV